jgi:hypothetical protein
MSNKIIIGLMTFFLIPLIANAVTWQMDSNPFIFPSVSVKKDISIKENAKIFSALYNAGKGIVTIRYNLPKNTKNAVLEIYSISGLKIKSFTVSSDLKEILWDVTSQKICAGIYIAILKYSSLQNKIQISIIK